jgi:phage tail tape-measure protein
MAKATKAKTAKTFTEADIEAEIARRMAEREKAAKAAKEARKSRKDVAGWHADPVTAEDMGYNVLAKGQQSDGEGRLVEVRALMADKGQVRVTIYPCGPWFRGVSAVGSSVKDAAEKVGHLLLDAAETLAAKGEAVDSLATDYTAAAKGHAYIPRKS